MCRPRLWCFLWLGVWLYDVPSTFMGVFVDGRVDQWCAIHVFGGFCGRKGGFVVCRPRFGRFCGREGRFIVCRPRLGVFLWTGGWLSGDPSMFSAVFVDGSVSYMLVVFIETLVSWSGVGVPEGNSCQPFEYIGAA